MNDLIRREDAIKAARLMIGLTADERENEIRAIPTIEERKEGKWVYEECQRLIDETDEGQVFATEKKWHCSQCGFSKGFMLYRPNEKYCPNCGARMEAK